MGASIYQIVNVYNYTLVNWTTVKKEAELWLMEAREYVPDERFEIIEGTDYIHNKCKGCETVHADERHDAYGITTGYWCEECFESEKYPYRRDRYPTLEHDGYGERLEDEY